MGSWSAGVWGNDTAEDLKFEYQCAFYRYDPEEAIRRLDEYVRTSVGDESDTIEWCNYIYSLADFMWKKGILTEAVKTAAVSMIDSGFGLDEWEKSGKSVLAKRRKALEKLRAQLLSPLPERKPIRLKFQTERVFSDGDYIAVRLMTKDKPFCSWAALVSDITQEQFPAFDGKYIILQKAFTQTGFRSAVVPDISDNWAAFRLCDGVYDDVPSGIDTASLKSAKIISLNRISPVFLCESKMSYFRKRKAQVIGHGTPPEISEKQKKDPNFPPSIFLRFSNASWDAEQPVSGVYGKRSGTPQGKTGDGDLVRYRVYRQRVHCIRLQPIAGRERGSAQKRGNSDTGTYPKRAGKRRRNIHAPLRKTLRLCHGKKQRR